MPTNQSIPAEEYYEYNNAVPEQYSLGQLPPQAKEFDNVDYTDTDGEVSDEEHHDQPTSSTTGNSGKKGKRRRRHRRNQERMIDKCDNWTSINYFSSTTNFSRRSS